MTEHSERKQKEDIKKLIQLELDDFFTPAQAVVWWLTPNTEFEHMTPLKMVNEGRGMEVLNLLRNFAR